MKLALWECCETEPNIITSSGKGASVCVAPRFPVGQHAGNSMLETGQLRNVLFLGRLILAHRFR